MEYFEDTQDFGEDALPNASLLDYGNFFPNDEVNKSVA